MKRLTYKTVGDAFREPHYCHGPGIKKDDLLQRLGKLEDAYEQIAKVIYNDRDPGIALHKIASAVTNLEEGAK